MAQTHRASAVFTAKEHHDGTPFIVFEPAGETLPGESKAIHGLDLAEGTTMDHARELADLLNEKARGHFVIRF